MSDQAALVPYEEARNFDQDAWYLYETTSPDYYELCARRCDEFAEHFNRLITGRGARGTPKVDYWVSRYLSHAENIRRGITFIQQAGDYMPMLDFLRSPAADYRGLIENAFGYEAREGWEKEFQRLSGACNLGSEALKNNEWKGLNWANRDGLGESRKILDRDDSDPGDKGQAIRLGVERGALLQPKAYPRFVVDQSVIGKPGQRCPRTGVWVPHQGLKDFSLAFCIEGRPMQPAYRILGEEPDIDFPSLRYIVTRAEDTVWHFVSRDSADIGGAALSGGVRGHGRCLAGMPCPREGWWFSPAKPDSRRRFSAGEVMLSLGGDYGVTIWQWDDHQG